MHRGLIHQVYEIEEMQEYNIRRGIIQEEYEMQDYNMRYMPRDFSSLPDGITGADFIDPISLEEPEEGEVYGFCVEEGRWYLAGRLEDLNKMIETGFRKSSKTSVFVPFKNAHVALKDIQWVRL